MLLRLNQSTDDFRVTALIINTLMFLFVSFLSVFLMGLTSQVENE